MSLSLAQLSPNLYSQPSSSSLSSAYSQLSSSHFPMISLDKSPPCQQVLRTALTHNLQDMESQQQNLLSHEE